MKVLVSWFNQPKVLMTTEFNCRMNSMNKLLRGFFRAALVNEVNFTLSLTYEEKWNSSCCLNENFLSKSFSYHEKSPLTSKKIFTLNTPIRRGQKPDKLWIESLLRGRAVKMFTNLCFCYFEMHWVYEEPLSLDKGNSALCHQIRRWQAQGK